jgi:hypothetical protein
MRVRITKSLDGSIDGIQLDRFVTGQIYEVGTSIGNYLMAEGSAVPIDGTPPPLELPIDAPITRLGRNPKHR